MSTTRTQKALICRRKNIHSPVLTTFSHWNLREDSHSLKLILRWSYHQVELDEESKEYLTINTHQGLYWYNRLVFGITSASAIRRRSIDCQVLEGMQGTSCILDDIIIAGKNDQEHFDRLGKVLKRLQEHGLRANQEKCVFFQTKVTYCTHAWSRQGWTTQNTRENWWRCQCTKARECPTRSFITLVSYHKFLSNSQNKVNNGSGSQDVRRLS